jgi:hypothetical protein
MVWLAVGVARYAPSPVCEASTRQSPAAVKVIVPEVSEQPPPLTLKLMDRALEAVALGD